MIRILISTALLLWGSASALSFVTGPASADDVSAARKILLQEKMNPLSMSTETLLVASTDAESSTVTGKKEKFMVGFGQIRKLDDHYSELASLYVNPPYRSNGIGTAIVSELLKRHEDHDASMNSNTVCLLTLHPTVPFYEKHAFRVVEKDMVPQPLKFEFAAGSLLSAILGNTIVCMIRD